MERASIDFPVPGSPTMIMCLLCSEAFLTTMEAASCPITWSTSLSGIGTCSVDSMSRSLIQSSTGVSQTGSLSSETPKADPSSHDSSGSFCLESPSEFESSCSAIAFPRGLSCQWHLLEGAFMSK